MAIEFRCEACGNLIQVADEHAGLHVKCPLCGAVVAAPRPAPAANQPPGSPGPPRMTPPLQAAFNAPPPEGVRQGLAIAAMACGIVGLCLPPLGLVAVALGIAALVKASNRPAEYGGRGPAIVGICTGGVGIVLIVPTLVIVSILLPSLARARELARRNVCAANLRTMGLGFVQYANENADDWPIAAHPPAAADTIGRVDYTRAIGSYRGRAGEPDAGNTALMSPPPGKLSTTRNLWLLVRIGAASPKALICPSSDDVPNDGYRADDYWDFGTGDITGPVDGKRAREFWHQVSYGYQVPYGKFGRPNSARHMDMVLAADKGPYGAALDGGHRTPPAFAVTASSPPDDWRLWNSPNHGGIGDGEGQNVLYVDCHAEFYLKPTAGADTDNIYTQWGGDGTEKRQRVRGNPPTLNGRQTPAGNTDSLIYP